MIHSERLTEKAREALSPAHELAQHDHNSQVEGANGHEPASDDGVKSQIKSRIMRYVHGPQPGRAIGKLRAVFALAVAVMGVINDLTVLLPTRPGRLALLGSLLNRPAPFSPSILPVLDTGRTLALILGFFLLVVAFGLCGRAGGCSAVFTRNLDGCGQDHDGLRALNDRDDRGPRAGDLHPLATISQPVPYRLSGHDDVARYYSGRSGTPHTRPGPWHGRRRDVPPCTHMAPWPACHGLCGQRRGFASTATPTLRQAGPITWW